jgi:hypothetical protein
LEAQRSPDAEIGGNGHRPRRVTRRAWLHVTTWVVPP